MFKGQARRLLKGTSVGRTARLGKHVRAPGLPDVVFEVDLTTDIRDRKLDVYASWGVPELWVEVPDAPMAGKRKRPGLTIHVLEDGENTPCAESVALPTWSARQIHAALNEPYASAITVGTLRRVGEAMGRLAGTDPDNDPFLGAERSISRRAGWREGREEGRRERLVQERLSMIERLLATRRSAWTRVERGRGPNRRHAARRGACGDP